MTKISKVFLIIFTAVLISGGCNFSKSTPTPIYDNPDGEDPFIGMPNPASFYCQEMGYELEMLETDQGTEGVCIFPNERNAKNGNSCPGAALSNGLSASARDITSMQVRAWQSAPSTTEAPARNMIFLSGSANRRRINPGSSLLFFIKDTTAIPACCVCCLISHPPDNLNQGVGPL